MGWRLRLSFFHHADTGKPNCLAKTLRFFLKGQPIDCEVGIVGEPGELRQRWRRMRREPGYFLGVDSLTSLVRMRRPAVRPQWPGVRRGSRGDPG